MTHATHNLPPGRVSAVLFDWDGTLVDTGEILLACWHTMTEEVLGYRFPSTEEEQRWALSRRAAESFPQLASDPDVVARMHVAFTGAYRAIAAEHVRAHPGAEDLLRGLVARGVRTGVVTSKTTDRVTIDAELTGLTSLVDVIITGDDVEQGKPDPQGIRMALTALGVDAAAALYVGDGTVDIRAGKAAGLRTVALTHGLSDRAGLEAENPDLIMDDLSPLLGAVERADGPAADAEPHATPASNPARGDRPSKEHT
jgi:HAD superfamily hydrolase (TIGR01509 family)